MKEFPEFKFQSYWPVDQPVDLRLDSPEVRIGLTDGGDIEPGAVLAVWAANSKDTLLEGLKGVIGSLPRPLYCKVPGPEELVRDIITGMAELGFSQLDVHLDMRLKPIPEVDYPDGVISGPGQDFAALAAIDAEVFPLYRQDEEELRNLASSDDWTVLSINAEGVPVGFVIGRIYGNDMNHLFVRSLAVQPQHRRKGLGRLLTSAILAWGRQRGADRSMLWLSDVENKPARKLYESFGYRGNGVEAELVIK